VLRGGGFFLKKGKGVFFRGSAFQVFRQVAGLQCGLGFAKTIFGEEKDFAKPRLNFCPRAGGVWGGMRAGLLLDFSAAAIKKYKKKKAPSGEPLGLVVS
tara:strand:- start:526 stop:822 length:297 start_codon:yes stop_codon:yes gene_type:complete